MPKMEIGQLQNLNLSGYKLIALDMDGTTLNSAGELSQKTIDTLNSPQFTNKTIMFATGRMPAAVAKILGKLDISKIVISNNGALISNLDSGETLLKNTLPDALVNELIDIHRKFNVTFNLNGVNTTYTEAYTKLSKQYEVDLKIKIKVVDDLTHHKNDIISGLFLGDKTKLLEIKDFLSQNFASINYVLIPDQNDIWMLQILPSNISKGKSLLDYAEKKHINKSEVIAFGDNYNDREMLSQVGLSIAMKNSQPEILDLADVVTASNDDDGVAFALNLLKSKEDQ